MNRYLPTVLLGLAAIGGVSALLVFQGTPDHNGNQSYQTVDQQEGSAPEGESPLAKNYTNTFTDDGRVAQQDQSGQPSFQGETPPHTPQSRIGKIESRPGEGSSVPPTTSPGRVSNCTTLTFEHQKLASHTNGEACANHNNLFSLEDGNVNPKSVCVRVNGAPVKHKLAKSRKKGDFQVLLGSVIGPHSKITISYCDQDTLCTESCEVKKDKFLSAIGGEVDTFADNSLLVQWDPKGKNKPSAIEKRLHKELQSLDSELAGVAGKNGKSGGKPVFSQWIKGGEAPSCMNAKRLVSSKLNVARRK